MTRLTRRFWIDQTASTALEYAILTATVSIVLIVGMDNVGMRLAATLMRSASLALAGAFGP